MEHEDLLVLCINCIGKKGRDGLMKEIEGLKQVFTEGTLKYYCPFCQIVIALKELSDEEKETVKRIRVKNDKD